MIGQLYDTRKSHLRQLGPTRLRKPGVIPSEPTAVRSG